VIGTLAVMLVGHSQMQHMVRVQPMKVAAAEGLFESENPAGLSLLTIGSLDQQSEVFSIRVPYLLSLLSYNSLEGEVKGIRELQAEYEATYGAGRNYTPSIVLNYWSFRAMVGAGILMFLLAAYALWRVYKNNFENANRLLKLLPFAILLPYLATATGWLLTELGRAPWIVFGLLRIEDAVSPNVTTGIVLLSLIAFTAIYAVLMAADIFLLRYFARQPEHVFQSDDVDAANPEMAF
jgi:cytochrome d ubiquinol oxidase subunit I